ncbi:MAG: hypothetical protein NXY59_08640 [Aigarchaeota archaeon]|nr:hypothetical protein [Candidatus Pelearchaeum maunauluense]
MLPSTRLGAFNLFSWGEFYGLGAQEASAFDYAFIAYDEALKFSLMAERLLDYLIESKKLSQELQALKSRNEELKNELDDLKKRYEETEARLRSLEDEAGGASIINVYSYNSSRGSCGCRADSC